jgi:putative acetyltransferase
VARIFQVETPQHIGQVRELFLEYAKSLNFDLCFQSFDQELAALPGDYAPPGGRLLIAEIDSMPAGCVALHALHSDKVHNACEMKRLYVRPQFRGKKLGQQLMEQVIAAAVEIGYERMLLDTVGGTMDAAIAMYRARGFREREPYRHNPHPGTLYMELELAKQAVGS